MKKMTTSIKINDSLERLLLKRIVEDGYGLRGKSRWVCEAVEGLLQLEHFPELVEYADEMDNLNQMVSLRLTEALMDEVEEAVIKVRAQYPSLEGVKSKIIRAGILQRLICNPELLVGGRRST